jgi:hypothetical protein
MPVPLRDSAGAKVVVNERSTLPVTIELRDGDAADAPLIANVVTAVWSLVDAAGAIINNRDRVALTVTAGVALIVATNADHANAGTTRLERRITVDVTYHSTLYGNNRRLTEEYVYYVAPLAGIPAGG